MSAVFGTGASGESEPGDESRVCQSRQHLARTTGVSPRGTDRGGGCLAARVEVVGYKGIGEQRHERLLDVEW
jgi:hypothetical protein